MEPKKKQIRKPRLKIPRKRDKEQTKLRLIAAVGEIVKDEGYCGLGVNKIAKKAGVNKKLIYRYFLTPDKLIEEFIQTKDYWISFATQLTQVVEGNQGGNLQDITKSILENQYRLFNAEEEMQRVFLWELTEKTPLMNSIALSREEVGSDLLKLTDEHFQGSAVDFRAISAILVSSIYYLVLHSKTHDGTFCGVDIGTDEGRNQIIKGIHHIIDMSFKAGESKKANGPGE